MTKSSREEVAHPGRIPLAVALLAASTLLSSGIGVLRDALLAESQGIDRGSGAYFAAFTVPDLLSYLLAGAALSIAFLPLYARRRKQDAAAAERLFAVVLGNVGVLGCLATLLLSIWADALIALQYPKFDPETRALCVRLTRIVLPAQICFAAGGVIQAALFARGRFAAAALSPLLYNLGIVAGGLCLAPHLGVEGFAWGVLAGAVAGPLGAPLVAARRAGLRLRPRIDPADADFHRYLVAAAPLMFGMTLLTVDEWYQRWFGGLLGVGAVAQLAFARRLMVAPVALVGQAIGVASLPALSQLWAEGRREELNRHVTTALRAALGLGLLAAGGVAALATPFVAAVYERGAFTAHDVAQVASLLLVMMPAMPAWALQQVVVRAFYARGDTWRPMLLGTAFALAALPLYWFLGSSHGVRGLAAASSLAICVNSAAMLLLARHWHGAPSLRVLAATGLRVLPLALACAVACRAALAAAGPGLGAWGQLAGGGAVYGGVALLGLWIFGDAELIAARDRLRRRFAARANANAE